jgi:amino acid transporter
MLLAIDPTNPTPDDRLLKFLSFVTISFICLIHVFSRKMGLVLNNCLAIYKIALLTFVVLAGFVALAGTRAKGADRSSEYGIKNLDNAFSGPNGGPYGYATAILGVLFSYQGWENANYVSHPCILNLGHS